MPKDQAQLAARIDARVKEAVEEYCRAKGLKMNRFIETALLDRLEEIEDIEDVKRLRTEPTRPLKDVLRDLKRDGLLQRRAHPDCGQATQTNRKTRPEPHGRSDSRPS